MDVLTEASDASAQRQAALALQIGKEFQSLREAIATLSGQVARLLTELGESA
jgi:hypothetical protein